MRPTFLHINGTLYWTIKLFNSLGELIDADSNPTVSVRKNGASTADVVTVTKRAATTGIYDCSYNPSGEIEGDIFTIEESALVDTIENHNESWNFSVISLERGTNNALTSGSGISGGDSKEDIWQYFSEKPIPVIIPNSESINNVRYYKEITIGSGSQAGAHIGGWYPIYLGDDQILQSKITPTARDVYFTDETGENVLQAYMLPRRHINTLDGIWTWFCQPVCIYDSTADKTLVVSMSEDGHRYITEWDHENMSGSTYLLSNTAPIEKDDHNNPAIAIRSDGRYIVAFTEHNLNGDHRVMISTNPGDASSWGSATTYTWGTAVSYTQIWRLSAENRLYLFFRDNIGSTRQWKFVTSDDDGETWSSPTVLLDSGANKIPYHRTWSNGVDTIRFLSVDDASAASRNNTGLYSFYYDGNWKNVDGSTISSLPISESNLHSSSIIFPRSTGVEERWIGDITEDSTGKIHILYYEYPNGDDNNHDLWYGIYDTGSWNVYKVMDEGTRFLPPTNTSISYPGVAVFDPLDHTKIAVARTINGIREIEIWKTNDNGSTWTIDEQITHKSSCQNFRPNYSYNRVAGKEPYLFWVGNGRYNSFTDYNTCIRQYPGGYAEAALVKLDLSGNNKTIRCYYGGPATDSWCDYRTLGEYQAPENLLLGTLAVNANVDYQDSWTSWKKPNFVSRNMQIDQSGPFPSWSFQNTSGDLTDRVLLDTNLNGASSVSAMIVGKWEMNSLGTQSFISQNVASKAGIVLRVNTSTKKVSFFPTLAPSGAIEILTSTANFNNSEIHLAYGEYNKDDTGKRLKLRIDETEITASGTLGTSLNTVDSEYHTVGQRNNTSTTERMTGNIYCAMLSKNTLPKVYTDTLSRAFLNPTTWVTIGEEVAVLDNISSGVITALDTNTPDVLLQIPKIGDTVKWTNQNAEEIIITYSEP